MSDHVPPDGPSPCNLAVVGEAPSHAEIIAGRGFVGPSGRMLWKKEEGDADLIGSIVCRARETVYVTNVCKVQLSDDEWRKLSLDQRAAFETELRAEIAESVCPILVLSFGVRAAKATIPDFTTMTACHGKAMHGYGHYLVMPLWHPAAYLRGNREVLGMLAADLSKVNDILACDGLIDAIKPFPLPVVVGPDWPESIAFLLRVGPVKAKCMLACKAKTVMAYKGDGLTWKLCMEHAIRSAEWAKTNLEGLRENARLTRLDAVRAKVRRTADRMQAEMCREGRN